MQLGYEEGGKIEEDRRFKSAVQYIVLCYTVIVDWKTAVGGLYVQFIQFVVEGKAFNCA